MVHKLSAWVVLGVLAATTGCSMCSHPYDYCGPVYQGGCNGYQCNGPRAGTIRAMGGPVMMPHPAMAPEEMVPAEMVPEQIDSYSQTTVPTAESAVYKPSSPLDLIVSPLVGAAPSAPTRSVRGGPDVRQYLPAGDRENAQILSVTDETLAEAQARAGQVAQTGTPTPATTTGTGTWTARRPSATQR